MALTATFLYAGTPMLAQTQPGGDTEPPGRPTFRSGIDLISVAAVVRDRRGHVVRDLTREDFVVLDNGVPRPIVEFSSAEEGPVSLALLFDVSGSMAVASGLDAARRTVDHLLGWLRPGADEVALFAFDRRLQEVQPFTSSAWELRGSLDNLGSFGMTSIYDAVAHMAERLAERPSRRRAIVLLTDGLDNASRLSAADVSGIASATDVPVYVIAVVSPLDHPGGRGFVGGDHSVQAAGMLSNLAWWTGGDVFTVSTDAHASIAARTLLAELRHQYVLAFETSGASGWRPLDIRLRRRELTVRTRSGYFSRPLG